jgi:hypothetical protein
MWVRLNRSQKCLTIPWKSARRNGKGLPEKHFQLDSKRLKRIESFSYTALLATDIFWPGGGEECI